ncbi:hypothetical protein INR49_022001, partial [Caranx melampygus]
MVMMVMMMVCRVTVSPAGVLTLRPSFFFHRVLQLLPRHPHQQCILGVGVDVLMAHQAAVEDSASGGRGDVTESPLATPARLGRPSGLDGDGDRHHHGDGDGGLGRWRGLVTLEEEETASSETTLHWDAAL